MNVSRRLAATGTLAALYLGAAAAASQAPPTATPTPGRPSVPEAPRALLPPPTPVPTPVPTPAPPRGLLDPWVPGGAVPQPAATPPPRPTPHPRALEEALERARRAGSLPPTEARRAEELVRAVTRAAKERDDAATHAALAELERLLERLPAGARNREVDALRQAARDAAAGARRRAAPPAQPLDRTGPVTVAFATDAGIVRVYLPDDLAAGDTISGTVSAQPSGATEKQRQRNAGTLRGYVVEAEDARSGSDGAPLRFVIPREREAVDFFLRDAKGRAIDSSAIPLVVPMPQPELTLPVIGQTGRPLVVAGPFDGDLATTRLTIGGRAAAPLAESPRTTVFTVPADVVGPVELVLEEAGRRSAATFRAVSVALRADSLHLRAGEQTRLTVEVSGLEGLETPIAVRLVNASPAVVRLAGGDEQVIVVEPSAVGAAGTHVRSVTMTGGLPGAFDISASLVRGR